MELSKNKDVKKAQRQILAAVLSLRSKNITPDDYDAIKEVLDHVAVVLKQQAREPKSKPKVEYFD